MTTRRRAVWFSDEDWARIKDEALALDLNPSAYLRMRAFRADAVTLPVELASSPHIDLTDPATLLTRYGVYGGSPERGKIRVDCALDDWGLTGTKELVDRELAKHVNAAHVLGDGIVPPEERVDPGLPAKAEMPKEPQLPNVDAVGRPVPARTPVPSGRPFRPAPKPEKKDKGRR